VNDEQLDELISGYLDGELSQQEKQDLELRLQSDPEAARRLRLLREARKALAESQAYRLPDRFADRVVALARQEAERLGLADDHPVRLGENRLSSNPSSISLSDEKPSVSLSNPVTDKPLKSNRWTWAYAAAAAVLLVAGTVWWQTHNGNNIQNKQSLAKQPGDSSKPMPVNPQNDIVPAEAPNETQVAQAGTSPRTLPSELKPSAVPQSKDDIAFAEMNSNKGQTDLANVAENKSSAPASTNPSSDVKGNSAPVSDPEMLKQLASAENGSIEAVNLLMVIDIALTKEAWENQSFSKILSEYDIRYERPLVADSSLNEALEESKLVAKSGTDASPVEIVSNENVGEVQFVFVQARAARIDNAIKDVLERIDEFPNLFFDLSLDAPCQEVVARLESSIHFESDGEDIYGIATTLQNANPLKDNKNPNIFTGSKPRGNAIPVANRQTKQKLLPEDPASMNPVSTVLFVLRKPEGASGQP